LRLGGAGETRQCQNAGLRQAIGAWQAGRQLPDFIKTLDRAGQFRRALKGRSRSEPVHRALPSTRRHHQKGVKPRFLVGRNPGRQQAPQPAVGPGTHPRDGAFEHACSR